MLPEYMVPTVIVVLSEWPLTPNGKIDRKQLPKPLSRSRKAADTGLKTIEEEILCEIWASILGLDDVGIEDNFFDLGGHSLLATQLVSRIRQAFGVELGL